MPGKARAGKAVAQERIAHADFERFLRGLVLEDVSLVKCSAELIDADADEANNRRLTVLFAERAEFVRSDDEVAEILATYGVRLVPRDGEPNPLAQFNASYRVRYRVQETMSEACFEQFRQVSLRIHTIPFAREWFRETSARMGLRPIVLPMTMAHPAPTPPAPKGGKKK